MEGASHVFLSVFNIYSLFHVAIYVFYFTWVLLATLLLYCNFVFPLSLFVLITLQLSRVMTDFTCALLFLMCIQSIYKKTNVNKRGSKLKGIKTNRLGPDVAFGPHFHPRFLFRHFVFVLIELTCALLSMFRCFCLSYSFKYLCWKTVAVVLQLNSRIVCVPQAAEKQSQCQK